MVDPVERVLARLARNLLFTRKDAYIHLPNAKAAVEVEAAAQAFWARVVSATGSRLDEPELAAVLAAGGVPLDQARRWSRAIVHEEDDDEIELDVPESCAHCGSGVRGRTACGVCGQARESAPLADRNATRAARLVRMLVASNRLELVSAHSERGVVEETAMVLNDHDDDALAIVAEALEAAWMARADVAEVFADTDELVAALHGV